tara:strand:+ start:4049 stop:4252 length:204 start_codon:yes stop_codon:yes gene_type:complete
MEKLFNILKKNLWIEVSPSMDTKSNEWIAAVYKYKEGEWMPELTEGNFRTAQDAYLWAFGQLDNYEA